MSTERIVGEIDLSGEMSCSPLLTVHNNNHSPSMSPVLLSLEEVEGCTELSDDMEELSLMSLTESEQHSLEDCNSLVVSDESDVTPNDEKEKEIQNPNDVCEVIDSSDVVIETEDTSEDGEQQQEKDKVQEQEKEQEQEQEQVLEEEQIEEQEDSTQNSQTENMEGAEEIMVEVTSCEEGADECLGEAETSMWFRKK
jgi:hypothetical protein